MSTIRTFADLDSENCEQSEQEFAVIPPNVLRQSILGTDPTFAKYADEEKQPLLVYTEQSIKYRLPSSSLIVDNGFYFLLVSRIHEDDMVLWGEGILVGGSISMSLLVNVEVQHVTIRFDTMEYFIINDDSLGDITIDTDTFFEFTVAFDPVAGMINYTLETEEGAPPIAGGWDIENEAYPGQAGFCGFAFDGEEAGTLMYYDDWRIQSLD